MQPPGTTPAPQEYNSQSKTDWPSVLQFGLCLFAITILWLMAISLAVMGLTQYFSTDAPLEESIAIFLMAAGIGFIGVLLIPSVIYSLQRLMGRHAPKVRSSHSNTLLLLLIASLPLLFGLGYWISTNNNLTLILLPIFHILAIGLPILILVILTLRGLQLGSAQRTWGTFGSGTVLAPAIAFTLEAFALIALVLFWAISISFQPEIADELLSLAEELQTTQPSPEVITSLLAPYLTSPAVLFSAFAFVAVIVALIEELAKPIGVWLLANRRLTPAEGFIAGVLCGAGFALTESLVLSSSTEAWSALVIVRIGTGVIHILTTALMGWALAIAWREGRYLRLGITYLSVVLLHALWNSLTLLTVFSSLSLSYPEVFEYGTLSRLGEFAPYAIGLLAIFSFILLLGMNRYFRRTTGDAANLNTNIV
jgi:hypothetical protein